MNKQWCSLIFLLFSLFLTHCKEKSSPYLFSSIPASKTGVDFDNHITEDKNFNIIEYLYFYNGGGVACGDINNDGLVDIYFSSNQNSNKLYMNKGNFKFEDITDKSGTKGIGNWKTGVTMADINGDGYLDIYVCGVGNYKNFNSQNQLLINNGDLTFSDKTEEYGLQFKGFSTQTIFFDFDLDGDLDCYLLNHSVHSASSYVSVTNRVKSDSLSGDQFFRNELISNGKNSRTTRFVNITKGAGILSSRLGYGLGVGVSDVNLDGYPDIYVSNDFQENDYLYINNKNGTFKQVLEKSLAHSSRFSMGNDIADVNNDGRPDIVTTDMLPRDEAVIKTSAGEDAYEVYKYKLKFGYHYQVARNCLQFNRFISDSLVTFSDLAPLAGVEATDWSWSPLLADFDNDGLKDLFVSNGIFRRPNDLDYINFISNQAIQDSLKTIESSDLGILNSMPDGKVANFVFKNVDGIHFKDVSTDWGINVPSFSNGSAYADLDNDGDLDVVVNNINEPAFVYQNNDKSSSITINLIGGQPNSFGIGAKILTYSGGKFQYHEVSATRGFSSASDTRVIVGIENSVKADSVLVVWPGGRFQKLNNIEAGKLISVKQSDAKLTFNYCRLVSSQRILEPLPKPFIPNFIHKEDDYNAFNNEGLIPHMLTTQGPPLAQGDVDGDGLSDVFMGGGKDQSASIFFQTRQGEWKEKFTKDFVSDAFAEDVAAELFDADGDHDLDLLVAAGGQDPSNKPQDLTPRLYKNDGRGNFQRDDNSIPRVILNASCIKPFDYDGDGDLDVFVGASVMPFLYGMAPQSYLLQNDGKGNFSDVQNWLGSSWFDNPTQVRSGLVKDATWTDVNLDGRVDLILVGEWMPITILIQNFNHQFENQTEQFGTKLTSGLWNAVEAFDFDGDGDDDYVLGNLGQNSRLRVSAEKPLIMYLGDFDSNGGSDHILVYYNGDKSYPFASRDQLIKQLPGLKKKFLRYKDYRNVNLEDIVTPQQKGNSARMQVEVLSSSYLRNDKGKLARVDLPAEAQLAPVFAIAMEDVNNDGFKDLIVGGNLDAVQPDFGRYDASIGLILLGDGKGNWKALDTQESGFLVKGETRHIRVVSNFKKEKIVLVSRNNQSMEGFKITPR